MTERVLVRARAALGVRCAVCHDDAVAAAPCVSCGALAHDECLESVSGCPTLGCRRRLAPASRSSWRPTCGARRRDVRDDPWQLAFVVFATVALVGGTMVTRFKDALGSSCERCRCRPSDQFNSRITSQIQ